MHEQNERKRQVIPPPTPPYTWSPRLRRFFSSDCGRLTTTLKKKHEYMPFQTNTMLHVICPDFFCMYRPKVNYRITNHVLSDAHRHLITRSAWFLNRVIQTLSYTNFQISAMKIYFTENCRIQATVGLQLLINT